MKRIVTAPLLLLALAVLLPYSAKAGDLSRIGMFQVGFLDTPWLEEKKPPPPAQPDYIPRKPLDVLFAGLASGFGLAMLWVAVVALRALLRRLKQAGQAAAPHFGQTAVLTAAASVQAINQARRSPLEKRLDEIERLYMSGKLTAQEREKARTSALEKK